MGFFMQRYRFKKIDAFVEGQSTGNPAGCIYLTDQKALSDEGMHQIARELARLCQRGRLCFP